MPKPVQPPPVSRGVQSYLLGDELLLFSPYAHAMFRLNPSAAFIWSCCEEGLDRPTIVKEMTQAFRLSATQAEQDLEVTLSEWETCGLLGCSDETPAAAGEVPADEVAMPKPQTKIHSFPAERRYQMLDTVFRLRFSDLAMVPFAQSAFAHLIVDEHCPFDVTLDVQSDAGRYFVLCDDRPIGWCNTQQQLAPLLHGKVISKAYERAECFIALHAAAVSNGNECLVFPAQSGSGKSTLTAALVSSGFKYCTDELVLLQRHTHLVQTIAAGIGTKPGSWSVLQAFDPRISTLPTHLRLDGKQVRYLLPDKQQLTEDLTEYHPVRALVFPVYGEGANARLQRLTPADALCRLTDAGSDMEGKLDSARATELVHWIAGMDSFELHYSDLGEAIGHVRSLLLPWNSCSRSWTSSQTS